MPMSSFEGGLKIAATADVIDASFHVDEGRLEVHSGEDQLGSWAIGDLHVERRGDGIHLVLDGEDVVATVSDLDAFVSAIAPARSRRRKPSHAKKNLRPDRKNREPKEQKSREPKEQKSRKPKEQKSRKATKSLVARLASAKELFSKDNWSEWLSDTTVRWFIASAGVVLFALLALFATNTLGMILVLLGMVALIVAALAVSDDLTAYGWVPGDLSEATVIIAGAIAMTIGGVLIIVG